MMKRISFYKFLLIAVIVAGMSACQDMMDFHKEFIKGGEIVYLTKVDSMVSYPGKNRIQLSGYLTNSYNVNKIAVYWNNRADSMLFDYVKKKDIDSLNLIIPNLAEKSYIFDVYTLNAAGNRSIKVSISAFVYGDLFRANLFPRSFNSFSWDKTKLNSFWLAADALEKGTSIRYTTVSSGVQTLFLSPDSAKITLTDRLPGTPLTYQSAFVPEKAAIDTFKTAWTTLQLSNYETKVSKAGWKIIGFDSQYPTNEAIYAIDDNINTIWHTPWDNSKIVFPHWFIVDMNANVEISTFEVYKRQGRTDGQTKNQFLTSMDGITWTDYGTFNLDPKQNAAQLFRSKTIPTARYIKYVALTGPTFYAHLGELSVYSPMR